MKRFLAPILLLTLLFPSLALGGEVKFDDLVKRGGIHYKKFSTVPFTGKVTGKIQGTFKDGKKNGPWVKYHDNGQLYYKGTYKNGKLDGPWVSYHKNGRLWSKGTFKDGKEVGPWIEYHKNGQLEEKVTYKNGQRRGSWVRYDNDGRLSFKRTYEDGFWVTYHDNGKLWTKSNYKNGKNDGPWVAYYENGQLVTKGTYKDGKTHGPWVGYNRDGTVWEGYTGTFKDGVKVNAKDGLDRDGDSKQVGHKFDVYFKMKVVRDKLAYLDPDNKSLGYEVKEGRSKSTSGLVNLSKGRGKKKDYDDPTEYNHGSETLRDGGVSLDDRVNEPDQDPIAAFLSSTVTMRTSGLSVPPYSDYQQFLHDKITELQERGLGYRKIAEWLRENGYKTTRGKRFYGNHVFSISKRMRQRQERITLKHPLEYGPLSIKLVDHTKSFEAKGLNP